MSLKRDIELNLLLPISQIESLQLTQDGRALRISKKRWVVERFFSWIQHFRKVETRYEIKSENFLGRVELASIMILLRRVSL